MKTTRTSRVLAHYLIDAVHAAECESVTSPDLGVILDEATDPAEVWSEVATAYGLTLDDLASHVARFFRLERADFREIVPHAINLVPGAIARRYTVCPLREDSRKLVVATADPTDIDAEQAIGFASGRKPVFAIADPRTLQRVINQYYAPERAVEGLLERLGASVDVSVEVVEEMVPEAVAEEEAEAAPVIKLTNLIIKEAVGARASDIHIESSRTGGTVRFRVDGVLRHYMHLPTAALQRVLSRIKVLGKLDIADRLRPQDGRARVQIQHHFYDLRVSTVPTRHGEKGVIRILDPERVLSLEELAMTGPEREAYRSLLGYRDGLVVVTGPTGSGKTTTLYAGISELDTAGHNVMTVEDPVEYELAGVNQIQVETKQHVTFASALRAILRQDPDIIFVGEIRDEETARIALQACMTGHLVLATLHTNDAVGVVPRLLDLGVDYSSLASSLRGVIGQRLLRQLCTHCAEPVDTLNPEERDAARVFGVEPTKRAVGCHKCVNTGYRGRIPASEVMTVNEEIEHLLADEASTVEIQAAALRGGMRLMRTSVLDAVREGRTTLTEVARVLGGHRRVERSNEGGVLLVEDDAVTRKVARRLLEREGMTVTEAADGQEALNIIESNGAFSLIVTDLEMPRMDGRTLLGELRRRPGTAAVPVIVLTASDDPETETQLMQDGADDYISKPIQPPVFIARVKGGLRRHGLT